MDNLIRSVCVKEFSVQLKLSDPNLKNGDDESHYIDRQHIIKSPFLLRIRIALWFLIMKRRHAKLSKAFARWNV